MNQIHSDIKEFMSKNAPDKVLFLRIAKNACLLRFKGGVSDTCEILPMSLYRVETGINLSTLFTVTPILKGCTYTNRSPQNTSISRVIELSRQQKVFVVGEYFNNIAAPIDRSFRYSYNDDTSDENSVSNKISNAMFDDLFPNSCIEDPILFIFDQRHQHHQIYYHCIPATNVQFFIRKFSTINPAYKPK